MRALAVQKAGIPLGTDARMLAYTMAGFAAALAMAAAAYVQLRLPRFTATPLRLALARAILLAIGLGCGYVGAQMYRDVPASVLAFIIGFGVVHLPATGILFLKGQRGESPS
jgi:hypothetical protein